MAEKVVEKITSKIIKWIPTIVSSFSNFHPELQKFQINYREKTAEIYYKLDLKNEDLRRKLSKIEIPNSGNYKIKAIFDEGMTDYIRIVSFDRTNQSYIISPKELPSGRHFLVILEGIIDPEGLKRLVYVQPAANQNSTKTYDKYWLQASIRDISFMERIYKALEIDEINCNVNISIERFFPVSFPATLKKQAEVIQNLIIAGRGRDRNQLYKAWRQVHLSRQEETTPEEFYEKIFDEEKLRNFISVDNPFQLGKIGPHKMENYIPVSFATEAITHLTLDNPLAKGFLSFHKTQFEKYISEHIES